MPGMKKRTKLKRGTGKNGKNGFGMLSVKAGVDKNPKSTQADRIAGATKRTKAIIVVHQFGHSANMGKILKGKRKVCFRICFCLMCPSSCPKTNISSSSSNKSIAPECKTIKGSVTPEV